MSVEQARNAVKAARYATENSLMEAIKEAEQRSSLYGEDSGLHDRAASKASEMRDRLGA